MGIKDWFSRKKTGPKEVGQSSGGSRLLKYDNDDSRKPRLGFLEESTLSNTEAREKIYSEMFGESDIVLHELLPLVPHVDVYRFPPNNDRDFFTYVTGGMSDLAMNCPEKLGRDFCRAELVFYSTENRDDYPQLLRWLAHFVHDNNTWLHWGHTMPNGQPPTPFFGTKKLDTLFFMPSILKPDSTLGDKLLIEEQPVHLIWCVPITSAECQLKLDKGSDAIYDLFEEKQHPFAFAGDRESYV